MSQQPNLAPIPELYVNADSAQKLKADAGDMLSWDLTPRQLCDVELLMNGGFYPLKGFLTEADYDGVVENMRLASGSLWPMPVTLDVSQDFADKIEPGTDIALRPGRGTPPVSWSVDLPGEGLELTVQAVNPDSAMTTSVPYWEGPVRVGGTMGGRGYLEMTGYPLD